MISEFAKQTESAECACLAALPAARLFDVQPQVNTVTSLRGPTGTLYEVAAPPRGKLCCRLKKHHAGKRGGNARQLISFQACPVVMAQYSII